jgi:acylphosphatase
MKMVRAHIFISGKVQMVLFRDTMTRKANRFKVRGWVRNLTDSRVEAVLEGEKEKVEALIGWARKGPFLSRVDNIDLDWEKYQGEFNNFKIRY